MFQSRRPWLWRAQAASRNGASSQDAFSPNFAQNGCIFSSVGWIHPSGFAPAIPMLEHGDPTPQFRGRPLLNFLCFLPSPQTPTFTLKPPGIFSFPDKPHQEITGIKDAGQIWKLSFKPQNEWREEITSQLLPPLPASVGQAKPSKKSTEITRSECSGKPQELL